MAQRMEEIVTETGDTIITGTDDAITRTSIRIPRDLKDAVEACARAMGVSANTAMMAALVDFVASDEHRRQVGAFFDEGKERFEALLNKLGT